MRFKDASGEAGASFSVPAAHRGAAFGDLNNDGKIDIVVTVLNGEPQLLINRSPNQNHWIILNLVGVIERIGMDWEPRMKITTASGAQYNEATWAVGYARPVTNACTSDWGRRPLWTELNSHGPRA